VTALDPARPEPLPAKFRLAHFLLGLVFDRYLTTHVSGREHLPAPGTPTILCANHSSALDVFAVGHALRRPAAFVAKEEATRYPVLGPYLVALGAIPAKRDKQDTDALRRMLAALRAGGVAGLAPEGTRSPDGTLRRFDPGFVWLALRTDALIVPTVVHGAFQLMPKGARMPRRGTMWVRFAPPMSLASEGRRVSRARMTELAETVRQRVLETIVELEEETGVPSPAASLPRAEDDERRNPSC